MSEIIIAQPIVYPGDIRPSFVALIDKDGVQLGLFPFNPDELSVDQAVAAALVRRYGPGHAARHTAQIEKKGRLSAAYLDQVSRGEPYLS